MGENIDMTLGLYFGFSTMVAAGIGNLFSDVVGLFFADFFGVGWRAAGHGCLVVVLPAVTVLVERLQATPRSFVVETAAHQGAVGRRDLSVCLRSRGPPLSSRSATKSQTGWHPLWHAGVHREFPY